MFRAFFAGAAIATPDRGVCDPPGPGRQIGASTGPMFRSERERTARMDISSGTRLAAGILGCVLSYPAASLAQSTDVTNTVTFHVDSQRTGWYQTETILT